MRNPPTSAWGCTNELLQQLVDAAPTALVVLESRMTVLGVNPEACELLGRSRDELVGRSVHATPMSERLKAAIEDLLENARRGHAQVAVEGPVAGAQAERWTRWTVASMQEGDATRWLLVGRDITELRALEQRRGADDALSHIAASCDSIDAAVPRLLRALCRTLGWDVGELWTVDDVADVLRCDGVWAVADLDADELAQVCRTVTLRPGEGLAGAAWSRGRVAQLSSLARGPSIERAGLDTALAFPIRGRDEIFGVVVLSSRRRRLVDTVMLEALESLGAQIGLLFDRIRARENLRRTEQALRSIHRIGTRPAASLETKIEALLREGRRWFGMEAGALVRSDGTLANSVVASGPPPGPDETDACAEVSQRGSCVSIEAVESPTPEDRPAWQRFIGSPVRVLDRVYGALGFWSTEPRRRRFSATDREILAVMAQWVGAELERVRLQEQLVDRERLAAIGMTAATFAHEVSNPLGNMALACELVARELGSPAGNVGTVLALVEKEVGRMGRLLEEFRGLSRTQPLNIESSCLRELVESVLTDFGPMLMTRGITSRLEGRKVSCSIDRDKMRQVIVNLVKNAAEAMPDGGALIVRVDGDERGARLEISDTGCGIPDGVDAFTPFATTKGEGTGLGLAVARQLVIAHQGRITFESAPDRGTRFVIELPESGVGASPLRAHASFSCS
jgi:PAS domain S-box-containing protein